MDIKLASNDDLEEGGKEMENKPKQEEEVDDEDIKAEVDKRKIVNNITQGSAKNTHRLIHLYRANIEEINPRLFQIADTLIKSQESFEWSPNNPMVNEPGGAGRIIRQMMSGYAKVEFEDEEKKEEDEVEVIEGLDPRGNNPLEEMDLDVEGILNGDEDAMEDFKDQINEIDMPGNTLKARAIDFVVLLHESVKAIYEVIGAAGIPQDEETAQVVIDNTDTLDDEFEDLRYGVYIRRDLLAFVSQNNKIMDIENGFEYVWGRMVEMPARDFLDLVKGCIIENYRTENLRVNVRVSGDEFEIIEGTPREVIDNIVDIIDDEMQNWKRSEFAYDEEHGDDDHSDDWKKDTEYDDEFSDDDDFAPPTDLISPADVSKEDTNIEDYGTWSQKELKKAIDKALDDGDMGLVHKIAKFVKYD